MQEIPFQSEHHRITKELEEYVRVLLGLHTFTNKEISELSGVGQNIVKAIDKQRLEGLYIEDGKLRHPSEQTRFLGIDEFKLHNGHKYATHIINMANGHILWIAEGKKKQVVYDFIEHVGLEWMSHVEAVALDMNSDFQEAFEEKCPHLRMVFDYFHIVKNFNDKVVGEIRKDEQKRLIAEGDLEAAKLLKHSKYIVTSSRETLARKDREAKEGRVLRKKGKVFSVSEVKRKDIGYLERYESILQKNRLLFTADLIKELLREAYASRNESRMQELITKVLDLCVNSGNEHMAWFWRLLVRHFDGIISHAVYHISAGKIEGINNKIKTLRRQAYGYPDDEYFFLKLIDMSRH
jgi:transposase